MSDISEDRQQQIASLVCVDFYLRFLGAYLVALMDAENICKILDAPEYSPMLPWLEHYCYSAGRCRGGAVEYFWQNLRSFLISTRYSKWSRIPLVVSQAWTKLQNHCLQPAAKLSISKNLN